MQVSEDRRHISTVSMDFVLNFVGCSTLSMTVTSTEPFCESSFRPSCSWRAV